MVQITDKYMDLHDNMLFQIFKIMLSNAYQKKAQTKDWAQFNNHETIVMVVIFRLIPPDLAYKLWMVNKRITIPLEIMYRLISVDFFLAYWIFRMPTL